MIVLLIILNILILVGLCLANDKLNVILAEIAIDKYGKRK